MNIKNYLKKNNLIIALYEKFSLGFQSLLTIISPVINSKYQYKRVFGKKLNLKQPCTFNEKLIWLKLNTYYKNPLIIQCADKYAARNYIEKCGYAGILNELYGVYERVSDIPWDDLPDKFVLKWNFGCGFNIICTDKSKLNIAEAKSQLKKWGRKKPYLQYSEMQYKGIKKKIICERYLGTDNGILPYDYKVYCFNGIPKAILVCMQRESKVKAVFMSTSWEYIETPKKYGEVFHVPPKPEDLSTMLESASCLSKGFPFVRIDYYVFNGKAIFGEMTFTPAGCLFTSQTDHQILPMGELLHI